MDRLRLILAHGATKGFEVASSPGGPPWNEVSSQGPVWAIERVQRIDLVVRVERDCLGTVFLLDLEVFVLLSAVIRAVIIMECGEVGCQLSGSVLDPMWDMLRVVEDRKANVKEDGTSHEDRNEDGRGFLQFSACVVAKVIGNLGSEFEAEVDEELDETCCIRHGWKVGR